MTSDGRQRQKRNRQRNQVLIVAAVLAVCALLVVVAGRDIFLAPVADPADNQPLPAGTPTSRAETSPGVDSRPPTIQSDKGIAVEAPIAQRTEVLVDDDGQTLWTSPTAGSAIEFSYLPLGCHVFLFLRPGDLWQHAEGEKVIAALGPGGAEQIAYVERVTGLRCRELQQLRVGWQLDRAGGWHVSLVARPNEPAAVEEVLHNLPEPVDREHAGQPYRVANGKAYFAPASSPGALVVTDPDQVAELIDMGGAPPPLSRGLEQLVADSDTERQATLFLTPNRLATDSGTNLPDTAARLQEPIDWFCGDGLTAMSISLHWADEFFVELRAAARIELSPEQLAAHLAERVRALPTRVEQYIFIELSPRPYSRQLIARLPAMVRQLAAYTRTEYQDDQAVLRCYLPVTAGHNLIMAAELALAEPPGSTGLAPPVESPLSPPTLDELLGRAATLQFRRDTLETALELLADEIGVVIHLNGSDLQAEGITRNQSFELDLADRPAGEILVEILRRANPDKSASSPADPRQKLVYVVQPNQPPTLEVTTRAAAVRRGDELPIVFRLP